MSHGTNGTGTSPAARSARRLLLTPRVVLIPSAAQARAAFMAASHAELGAYLGALGLNVAAGSALGRKAERLAECLRVLGSYPNYARAALWHQRLVEASDVPAASALRAELPSLQPGVAGADSFARPDGRDLEEYQGVLGDAPPPPPGGSGAPTPFGAIVAAPASGGAATALSDAQRDALLLSLVAANNQMVGDFDSALVDRQNEYVRAQNRGTAAVQLYRGVRATQ